MISCFNLTVFAEEPTTEAVLFHYSTKSFKKLKNKTDFMELITFLRLIYLCKINISLKDLKQRSL